jgi:hypothetical protein
MGIHGQIIRTTGLGIQQYRTIATREPTNIRVIK